MTKSSRRTGWRAAAGCLLACASAGALAAQEPRCPDGDPRVVRVEITFDRGAGTVKVAPETAEIYKSVAPGVALRACWVVLGLVGKEELRFFGKDANDDDYFPSLQRVVKASSPFANSGNPSRLGKWVYGVRVVDENGGTLGEVDPIIIIKGDSGSAGG